MEDGFAKCLTYQARTLLIVAIGGDSLHIGAPPGRRVSLTISRIIDE